MDSLRAELNQIETLIRNGDHHGARQRLKAIASGSIPRPDAAQLANLAGRSGMLDKGLRLLHPLVRNPESAPTEIEKLEYANLLIRSGALPEARHILSGINEQTTPEKLLSWTGTLTPAWRYAETVDPLRAFIAQSVGYSNLVARVNLLAALLFCERPDEMEPLLAETKEAAKALGAHFLLSRLCEIAAQQAIVRSDFTKAERNLDEAKPRDGEKWRILLEFYREKNLDVALPKLRDLRARSLQFRDWETVRDCDLHELRRDAKPELFNYLFCGTPFPAFRERLLRSIRGAKEPQSLFCWQPSGPFGGKDYLVEVDSARLSDGNEVLPPGQAPHRLLIVLSRDFYKPCETAYLAAHVFPEEPYHPRHTPEKMQQEVHRLRTALAAWGIPLGVRSHEGLVWLDGACALRKNWRLDAKTPDAALIEVMPLFSSIPIGQTFSTKEAASILGTSLSTASRKLEAAVTKGWCAREGQGRAAHYRLSQTETPPGFPIMKAA